VTKTGPPTLTSTPFLAIADTRCTAHFFTMDTPMCNVCPTMQPITIHTPSGALLKSMHEAELNLPALPLAARQGHIVPHLAMQPLLSIGQLCNAGCDVAFTAQDIIIQHQHGNIILHGQWKPGVGLWELDLQNNTPHTAHAAISTANPATLVAFAHTALFSPAASMLAEALR